ncbi:DUF397 domain-containing protein [Cryptosporangium japonicum]|uniref:DUF397 domain-containing protein n=1 Tax=Cryptosporangium japonicum TaxID=80872 RepID=UPI0031D2E730
MGTMMSKLPGELGDGRTPWGFESEFSWRKSSRCSHGECVWAGVPARGFVAVRDDRAALVVSASAWSAFLDGAKAGEFDPARANGEYRG